MGTFKDELPPNSKNGFIKEFCGLKSKMYSLKTTEDDEPIMKAKGINKVALSGIKHNDYLKCLKSFHQQETTVQSFRSYSHRIYSTVSKKSSLNAFDDKRYLLCDNITTLPFGHYKYSCDGMLSDELDTEYGGSSSLLVDSEVETMARTTVTNEKLKYQLAEHKTVTVNAFHGKIY